MKRDAFTKSNLLIFIQRGFHISLPRGSATPDIKFSARGAPADARESGETRTLNGANTCEIEPSCTIFRKCLKIIITQITQIDVLSLVTIFTLQKMYRNEIMGLINVSLLVECTYFWKNATTKQAETTVETLKRCAWNDVVFE